MSWITSARKAREADYWSGSGRNPPDLIWMVPFVVLLLALVTEAIITWIRVEHYGVWWDVVPPIVVLTCLFAGWLHITSYRGYVWYRLIVTSALVVSCCLQPFLVYNVGQSPYVQTYSRTDRTLNEVEMVRFFDKKSEIIVLADEERLNTEMVVAEDFRANLKVRLDPAASLAVLKAHLDSAAVTLHDHPWVYVSVGRVFENDLKRVVAQVQSKWAGASRQVEAPGLSKEFAREVRLGLEDHGWKFLEFDASRFKRD